MPVDRLRPAPHFRLVNWHAHKSCRPAEGHELFSILDALFVYPAKIPSYNPDGTTERSGVNEGSSMT